MKPRRPRVLLTVAASTCALALALPLGAIAAPADDDREVRTKGFCSGRSESSLRARADDGSIRVELRIDTRRRAAAWNVIVLHERRIVFRGVLWTSRSSGSLRLRRNVPDLFGTDTIVVRASGPLREVCRVSATL